MPLASITGWITNAVGDHGVYAVFGLMVVGAVLPAATEIVMVYAGAVAAGAFAGQSVSLFGDRVSSEPWALVTMALVGTLGYLAGGVLGWAIGAFGGRPFLERRGRLLHVSPERLERAERWFGRFGDWAVLVGSLTPVVRSFVAIPAGIARMPLPRYVLLALFGTLPWAFGLGGAGYALGQHWETFEHRFRYANYAVVALVVVAAVIVLARRRSRRLTTETPQPIGPKGKRG